MESASLRVCSVHRRSKAEQPIAYGRLMVTGGRSRLLLFAREWRDYVRLFREENAARRRLVFYAEKAYTHQYYQGYINHVLQNSDLDIAYVTSDPDDPILEDASTRVHAFYVNHLLSSTLMRLDARAVVMTSPELGRGHFRRSRRGAHHVYAAHAVGSIHLQYRKGAFDQYDCVLCVGPNDHAELQRWWQLRGLEPRTLVKCGYHRIETIYHTHQRLREQGRLGRASHPVILIAPSWHDENILASCIDAVIRELGGTRFQLIVRPHPEMIKRWPRRLSAIRRRLESVPNVLMELDATSEVGMHQAEVLVTDWSAIAFEYAFGTERPVLFVDTPCKISNPDYQELGITPIEFTLREQIGHRIAVDELDKIAVVLEGLIEQREQHRQRIVDCRSSCLYNWLRAAEVGGDYLIRTCAPPAPAGASRRGS